MDPNFVLDQTVSSGDILDNSVSSGDFIFYSTPDNSGDLLQELQLHSTLLEEIVDNTTAETYTIWNKPLYDYTVSESLDLITLFLVLAFILFKWIGDIITCKEL